MNDCFAAREKKCDCLNMTMDKCPGEKCKFYKTKGQEARESINALRRVEKLSKEQRMMVEDTYFK